MTAVEEGTFGGGILAFPAIWDNMKSRVLSILVLVFLVSVGVCWHASRRVSTGPDVGAGVQGDVSGGGVEASTVRFGTYNIHGCKGLDGRRDPDRVARDLEGLDFVGLNEVRRKPFAGEDQAEVLGQRVGMGWLFAPAESRWYGRELFGNALLTRLPVDRWLRIPLPRKHDYSSRNMLLADVRHGGETIRVLVAHVNQRSPRERRMQLECVLGMFLSLDEPAVLVGDLNTGREDPAISAALATPGVVSPVDEVLAGEKLEMIDWILVRGLRGVDGGVRDSGASDHPLIWVELEIIGKTSKEGT